MIFFTSNCEQDWTLSNSADFLVVFLDLDGLKHINDQYGHHSGDCAIRVMADILVQVFRKSDIIARLGGDEFVVLAVDCTIQKYSNLVERMNKKIQDFNNTNTQPFTLSISSGAAPATKKRGYTLEELMEEADKELYKTKLAKKQAAANKSQKK